MTTRISPTIGLRRVTAELIQLRRAAGLTTTEAARRAGKHPSLLTRLERREVAAADAEFVGRLLDVYGVGDPARREQILLWALQSRQRGWWHEDRKLLGEHTTYVGLEAEAKVLRVYEPTVIPGLLQTPEYTAALVRGRIRGVADDEVERRVRVRQGRQERLLDGREQAFTLKAVVGAAALWQAAGGRDAMVAQLDHLARMAEHPQVELQVLPMGRGIPPARGPFTILTFKHPVDPEVVYVDNPSGVEWLEDHELVQEYDSVFEVLVAMSLSLADSVRAISHVRETIAKEPEEYGTCGYKPLGLA